MLGCSHGRASRGPPPQTSRRQWNAGGQHGGTSTRTSTQAGAPIATRTASGRPETLPADFAPDSSLKVRADDYNLRITGIGGTGIVTVAQVVTTAATVAGPYFRNIDQMGMAQKGGGSCPTFDSRSSPSLSRTRSAPANATSTSDATCSLLRCRANLEVTNAERTIAVLSTAEVPTGEMVTDVHSRAASNAASPTSSTAP